MKITELRQKSKEELEALSQEWTHRIDEIRFSISEGKQKNVKEIHNTKKNIAKIKTLLHMQKFKM